MGRLEESLGEKLAECVDAALEQHKAAVEAALKAAMEECTRALVQQEVAAQLAAIKERIFVDLGSVKEGAQQGEGSGEAKGSGTFPGVFGLSR